MLSCGADAPTDGLGQSYASSPAVVAAAASDGASDETPGASSFEPDNPSAPAPGARDPSGGTLSDPEQILSDDAPTAASGSSTDADGFTLDPPPAQVVGTPTGLTLDPPPGHTEDPPSGETGDPPSGETGDPPPGETGDPPPGDTGDPPPGDTVDPPSECVPTGLSRINVLVFEDANPSGADTLGSVYVGGDAHLVQYAVGSGLPSDCTRDDLVVGGNLTGSPIAHNGAVAYGTLGVSGASFGCDARQDAPVDFDTLRRDVEAYSAGLAGYDPSGQVESAHTNLRLVGSEPALNVFSLTAEQLAEARSFQIDVPEGSSVLVNVSGKDVTWTHCGFAMPDGTGSCISGGSSWCHRILYNFYEAENLHLDGIGVQGSVLAPHAALNDPAHHGVGGGNVDGQVVVEFLYGNTEYHDFYFTGCLLLPVRS